MTRLVWSCLVAAALAGCAKQAPPPDPRTRFKNTTLKVLIPDLASIRVAIEEERGEWSARTGGTVELQTVRIADLVAPDGAIPGSALAARNITPGDIVVFPATEMANVVAAGYATKLPKNIVDLPDFERLDIARAVQDRIMAWDRQPHAIPISVECMLLYYRLDLFSDPKRRADFQEKHGRTMEPPRTWSEFDELAAFLDGQDFDGDGEPDRAVALSSPGEALLCRAATLGKVPQNFSFFFDVNSFEPLAEKPAFHQALEQWTALRSMLVEPSDEALAFFTDGKAAMAIASSRFAGPWLRSDGTGPAKQLAGRIACSPMPASSRVYYHDKQEWIDLPEDKPNRVAVVDGVVGSVTARAENAEAAYDFLIHLTSRERSLPFVMTPSVGLGPYRTSHILDAAAWESMGWSSAGVGSYIAALRRSLDESNAVSFLRIDGSERYHRALDETASAALRGTRPISEALEALSASWQAITDERGRDRQRRSYRYSLGMPVLD